MPREAPEVGRKNIRGTPAPAKPGRSLMALPAYCVLCLCFGRAFGNTEPARTR